MSSGSSVPTRQRLITAAAELFRRQGYAATGIKAILTAAGAPYGSLYHFFPGGKADLGVAVIEEGGLAYRALVAMFFHDDVDPVDATEQFFSLRRHDKHRTAYGHDKIGWIDPALLTNSGHYQICRA